MPSDDKNSPFFWQCELKSISPYFLCLVLLNIFHIPHIVVAAPKCRKSKFGEIVLFPFLELTSWHASTLKNLYVYANQKL
jgi:hypothetical protein